MVSRMMAGYYRRFIENFSKIAKPLTLLTQKNKTYVWGDKQEEAFQILKEKLCNASWAVRGRNVDWGDVGARWNVFLDWVEVVWGDGGRKSEEVSMKSDMWRGGGDGWGCGGEWVRLRFGKTHSEASRDLKAPTEWLRDKKRPFEQTRWMVKFTSLIVSGLPSVEASLIGPEKLVPRKLTEKIIQIKERLKTARSRQKSYADKRSKPLKFQVGDRVLLKVSPWKGVVPLDEIEIDENLRFVEEPIEIVERDVKKLKRRRNSLGPSSLNSQHGNK
ncbi:hypothetical protein Tco_1562099 [Tanacetum coccineum]